MISDAIERQAKALIRKYDTRDPYELCSCLGVKVQVDDIGSLKGMYVYIKRNRYIVLNSNLDEQTRRMVCAHELGHDQLHQEMAKYNFIHDSELCDFTSKPEYEANMFAATLLIEDKEFIDLAQGGLDITGLAREFCVAPDLITLKGRLLNNRGYRLRTFEHRANFLKY